MAISGHQGWVQKNFTIPDFSGVNVGGKAIDLHNLYGVVSIGTDPSGNAITLAFRRDHQWPGPEGLPEKVTLTCSGNLQLAFNDLVDAPVPLREDAVEIAYYDEQCEWDAILDEQLAAAQGFVGLHVSFSGGLVLRVRSDVADLALD